MKLSNLHIIGFLLTIFFVKQLNLDINLLVNIVILLVVVYYYYNENEVDITNKNNLTEFLNGSSNDSEQLVIKKTEPIIEYLEKLRLFAETHDHINKDVVKQLILKTNTLFKEKSVFYREHINHLLEEIELLNDINIDDRQEYLEIKNKIVTELDKIVEIKEPILFYQFKGKYKIY